VPGQGQAGLLDIALHPHFTQNRQIYFSYVINDGDERYALAVARARLEDDELHNVQRIFTALPWGSSKSNFGGALLFDGAGYLFVATGDHSIRSDAQHPGLLTGKVVRLRDGA
jgi:glucose/arabinose dehydrogenase